MSRLAENSWERATIGDRPKSCFYDRDIDQYMLDSDAEFDDGATCGVRETETDEEREVYGDTVKVCNDFAPFEGANGPGPVSGSDEVTGSSHLLSHVADRYITLDWPSGIAQSEGSFYRCTRSTKTNYKTYVPSGHQIRTKITVDWCYDYRNRVEMVQTLRASSEIYASESTLILHKFCEWYEGYSPSDPNETIWQYEHPDEDEGELLDWGYTSQVKAKYGNKKIKKSWGKLIPACSTTVFSAQATVTADWEGQAG